MISINRMIEIVFGIIIAAYVMEPLSSAFMDIFKELAIIAGGSIGVLIIIIGVLVTQYDSIRW